MADTTLTELQRTVLELFFTLSESEGFVLAGGAGLVATGLSTRPTQDIDLFGADLAIGVAPAANALEASCLTRRWTVERIRDSATFRRLIIRRDDEELLVDLAIDTPPLGAPTITTLGPTYSVEELAAQRSWRCSTAPRLATSSTSTRCRNTSTWIASPTSPVSSTAASPATSWPSPSPPTSASRMTSSPLSEPTLISSAASSSNGVPDCSTKGSDRVFTIHATKKLRDRVKAPLTDPIEAPSTALGNWYATALFWKPQVALFVNEATLLPVLVPLAPTKSLAERFPAHLEAVLNALGTDPRFMAAEVAATVDARWAKTANRSVVGITNEFSFLAEVDRAHEHGNDLVSLAVRLAGTPCSPLYKRQSFPDNELAALVATHLPG